MLYLLAFGISLLIAWVVTPYAGKLAFRIGAVAQPGPRRIHKKPTPLIGGLAIYAAFVVSSLLFLPLNHETVGMLLGATVIVALGLIDDAKELSPKAKILGQLAAAVILVLFGYEIRWVTNPFGGMFDLKILAIPVTIFWTVAMTNLINLIDGLDGLAAGISIIASFTLFLFARQLGYVNIALITVSLAGGALGFLRYNFNPAQIFMGDTGAMFLGYILAAASIQGAVKSAAAIAIVVPMLALGLPIFDTVFAIVRRYLNGMPISQADKGHIHHRLLAIGLSQRQAVLLMYCISAVLSAVAISLTRVDHLRGIMLIAVVAVGMLWGAKRLGILEIHPETQHVSGHNSKSM